MARGRKSQANSTASSTTCRRRRAGANGWAGSRRRSSPPPSRCCARTWRAWSARPATSSSSSTTFATNCAAVPMRSSRVAGGWSFRTKLGFGEAIRAALGGPQKTELSRSNALVLMAIGYFQPITRAELSQFLGREVSRDAIAALRGEGLIAAGPRSPTPGAPYAYVTTPMFLSHFGFESLRDLPDIEKLEDAGLHRPNQRSAARRRRAGVRTRRGAGAEGRRVGGGCGVTTADQRT